MRSRSPQELRFPLAALARAVAGQVIKGEVRRRFGILEKEPLGYLIRAGITRHQALGGEWTDEAVHAFLDEVPDIVECARQDKLRDEGGEGDVNGEGGDGGDR